MRKLKRILKKNSGRSYGKVTVRHQGGRRKRFLRAVDFKRDKDGVWGTVVSVEYDPNRNVGLALVSYSDGDKRYILAAEGIGVGGKVLSSDKAPLNVGNCLRLARIPVGTVVHNIEVRPGLGGQLARGAGSSAIVHGREEKYVLVKLPSGEIRRLSPNCRATVGQVGNAAYRSRNFRKAGVKRRMGIRPTVRGTAQHPGAHPHGGGEGRSSVGMKYPKTPQGKPAVGKTRNKRKYSNKYIVQRRKPGKHGGGA
jgi:large subunit ribosomal protein L2